MPITALMEVAWHVGRTDEWDHLAWRPVERPTNPMTIVAVLILEGRVTHSRLRSVLAGRLLRFERFRELPGTTRSARVG